MKHAVKNCSKYSILANIIHIDPFKLKWINIAWFAPGWTLRLLPSRTSYISLGTNSAQNLFLFPVLSPSSQLLYFLAFDYSDKLKPKALVIYPSPLWIRNKITDPRSNPVRRLHARESLSFFPTLFYFR